MIYVKAFRIIEGKLNYKNEILNKSNLFDFVVELNWLTDFFKLSSGKRLLKTPKLFENTTIKVLTENPRKTYFVD